jgi:hypothetical protein
MAGYDPETLTLLRTALDEAWASLPAGRKPETLKSEMAQRILKRAADGVRDPARLRASALIGLVIGPIPLAAGRRGGVAGGKSTSFEPEGASSGRRLQVDGKGQGI